MFNKFNNTLFNDHNHLKTKKNDLIDVLSDYNDTTDDEKENIIKIDHNNNDNSKMTYKNLNNFININKCSYGNKEFTHNLWDNTKNILFKVKNEEYETFLDLYSKELDKNFGNMHIMEKPLDIGPLCLDFDLKINQNTRCLEIIQITKIIQTINNVIKENYKLNDENDDLTCFILTKDKPYFDEEKKLFSDGFHIQYPNLILESKDRFVIFEKTKDKLVQSGVFDELFKILILRNLEYDTNKNYSINENDDFIDENNNKVPENIIKKTMQEIIKEVFDSSVIKKNCWFLYGSGKKKTSGTYFYKVVYIFDAEMNEYEKIPDKEELCKILSIRTENLTPILPNVDLSNCYKLITEKYMKNTRINVKNMFNKNINNNDNNNDNNEINENVLPNDNNEPLIIAKKLIKLLNKKRAGPYSEWIAVGWTLYNISPSLLPEFIAFSKQDNKKYQEGCCEKIWDECSKRIIDGGYTIASLYMWAKEDNPEEYIKLIRSSVNKLLEEVNTKADYDIAKIIKELYKFEYKCTSIRDNLWWQFENHRWKKIDSAYTLGIKLSEEVAKEFALLSASYVKESALTNGYKADILIKKSSDINKLILELKKTPYKERLIRECSPLFYDNAFEEKLDSNKYLIGFNNGIFDLRINTFRKGCPDDFISLSTGYDFKDNYNENNEEIILLNKFLSSVFPDDELRKYFLCFIASIIEGGNTDQKMFFWTGSGSNGKGTITELIDITLGDYYSTIPVSLLTVKRKSSSNATPELADKVGKRILVMNEPEHDDEINAGLMKELTGQDKIMARPLYGKPFYYIPQFVPVLPCNHLPKLSKSDGGTNRRIRVIEFSQKFVDEPTKPNEHPKDPELRNKLKTWHKPFIWLLLKVYYPIYKKYGIEKLEPECVKISTKKYEKDSNVFSEFKDEFICPKLDGRVAKEFINRLFKEWYSNNYNERKIPSPKELYKYLEEDLGYELRNNRFCGFILRDQAGEDDNEIL
jgi:P4 family phage/plasmid primase-like protien